MRRGNSIDSTDSSGQTALCKAYHNQQWAAYNLMMHYGANPNAGCMLEKSRPYAKPLIIGTGVVAIGGGVALAVSSGGGGSLQNCL